MGNNLFKKKKQKQNLMEPKIYDHEVSLLYPQLLQGRWDWLNYD
jgi:hypothetical protein